MGPCVSLMLSSHSLQKVFLTSQEKEGRQLVLIQNKF